MGEQPMKKIRRWMATLLIFTMVLSGNILVVHGEIPSATKEFYVNDYAGVFSDSWKETLCEAGKQLHDDTTAQLVVLTVDSTDQKTRIMEFWLYFPFLIVKFGSLSDMAWKESCRMRRQDGFWMSMQFLLIKKIILKKVLCNFIMHC